MNDTKLPKEFYDLLFEAVKKVSDAFEKFAETMGEISITVCKPVFWAEFYERMRKQEKAERYLRKYQRRGERMRRGK